MDEARVDPERLRVNHARATNRGLKRDSNVIVIACRDHISVHSKQRIELGQAIHVEYPWTRSGRHGSDWNWHLVFNYLSCEKARRSSDYPDMLHVFDRWDPVIIRARDARDNRWLAELSVKYAISKEALWRFYNVVCSHCMQSVYDEDLHEDGEGRMYVSCDDDGNPLVQRGMYDVLGCVRHRCDANAYCTPYDTGVDQGTLCLYASRRIDRGEEICISYANPNLTGFPRRSYLWDTFEIRCDCDLCTDDEALSSTVDGRRTNDEGKIASVDEACRRHERFGRRRV
ncbi:hypothetical protein CYMTET_41744 [Cymbomonas tetramitiformis]|uniref:SET domain-containing protein n=1 Tax=Cymbomonas tetramitiformis TaxID=36881 RepID=A0AAE0BF83_9CHLO|nr:hypothetical protein CYMTET_54288 [Cymbomonas tetramitiformis]KAK3236088.1 hypothetical protein CYMTET_53757 [Cymbomonas tetramitiformis]KAK3248834.1 hypothetical protein CYMTET_41744 [Cymbomonas tetramitiformis]